MAQFEGKIDMKTFSKDTEENAQVEWSIKDGMYLMSFDSKTEERLEYSMLIKDAKKELWFLSVHDNGAYQIPYQVMSQKDLNLPLNSVVQKTEEKSKKAGFDCIKYKIISTKVTIDIWISDDTGITHSDMPSFMKNGTLLGVLKLNGIQGFPLEFEVKDMAGELLNGQYIEKITAQKLATSSFEVPSNYEIKTSTSK